MTIYQRTLPEFKGNLHLHTTASDGRLTPMEAAARYEEAGYDFLAVTDHRILTRLPEYRGRMLLLNGIEMDEEGPGGEQIHLLGIGMAEDFPKGRLERRPSQASIDLIHQYRGLCFLAHPHWSMNRPATLRALRGLDGAEIWNSVSLPPYNPHRAEATFLLDLMASEGLLFNTLANDDTHHYEHELFQGFLCLQAEALTRDAVLRALKEGRYYASQGPRFEQVLFQEGRVSVTCSPVRSIAFHSNLPWNENRAVMGQGLTRAEYPVNLARGEAFIRVVIEDDQGRKAWLNPFPL